jgi:3-isopropylmalate/(R)-2-methylmalate dehydratase small subunit
VAESYAEIFFGNSTTLGIPCFTAGRQQIRELAAAIDADPELTVELDVENEVIRCGGKEYPGALRDSARNSLLSGRWDPIAELIEGTEQVDELARRLNYV